mgnify:CR=1 FL=1
MTALELELMVVNETIWEAEEAFDQLRKDYHALREHTDKLEAILKEHDISFPAFWG